MWRSEVSAPARHYNHFIYLFIYFPHLELISHASLNNSFFSTFIDQQCNNICCYCYYIVHNLSFQDDLPGQNIGMKTVVNLLFKKINKSSSLSVCARYFGLPVTRWRCSSVYDRHFRRCWSRQSRAGGSSPD